MALDLPLVILHLLGAVPALPLPQHLVLEAVLDHHQHSAVLQAFLVALVQLQLQVVGLEGKSTRKLVTLKEHPC